MPLCFDGAVVEPRTSDPPSPAAGEMWVRSDERLWKCKVDGDLEATVAANNWAATTDPGISDDETDGYAVGSRWINTTGDKEFACLDPSTGAAVWKETTGTGGGDSDAIHDNVDGEINAITAKDTPVGADVVIIEDSAASYSKKKVLISNLPSGSPPAHASSHQHGGGDEVATATPAANAIPKAGAGGDLDGGWITYGSSGGTACEGNDSRLSDSRPPTSHASSHQNGGSDEIATVTPGANAIPKAGAGGDLAAGWLPAASESAAGAVEIATQAEVNAGTDDARAVTPLKLANAPSKQVPTLVVESPSASEDIPVGFTDRALTITKIAHVVKGSSPSVTWTIRHSTDRSATGAEVVTGGTTSTSQNGATVTSFDDATIPADSYFWLETTAQTGTVDWLQVTIIYTED